MKCYLLAAAELTIVCASVALYAPLSAQTANPRAIVRGHTDSVVSLAFSSDGITLASGSGDLSVRLWDLATGHNTFTAKDIGAYKWCSVAFRPGGGALASVGQDTRIKLLDLRTNKWTTLLDEESQCVRPVVVFSPNGRLLASAGMCDTEITLWNLATGKKTATLNGHDKYGVSAMVFAPDSKMLVSTGYRGGIKYWDVSTGKLFFPTLKPAERERVENLIAKLGNANFDERENAAKELEGIPLALDMLRIAARDRDGKISGRAAGLVTLLEARAVTAQSVASAAFSDDAKILATANTDNDVKLWEISTGKILATLKGHTADVWSVVFSPDGRILASGSADKSIKLWDVSTGKELVVLKGHADEVWSLAFSPDGKTLASGSKDKTIMLWNVPTGK